MDVKKIRKDFPILNQSNDGKALIYLDSAATSQKPMHVIDAISDFYKNYNANISRGIYDLGEKTTELYEQARETVATFIGANPNEIVFTSGATQGINFITRAWGDKNIHAGDEIIITELEHHSNMIPWQQLAERTGAVLKYIPVNFDGMLALEMLPELITKKTKLIAVTHVSNAIGTHVDIEHIIKQAHAVGARVLIDACQSVPHQKINVHKLNVDFLVFSGHKMFGPTGIGVLYIKEKLHDEVSPYQFGGGMIYDADLYHARWLKAPHKFEAGTPPIAQAIGLAAAIDYINKNIDFDELKKHEAELCARLIDGLLQHKAITIFGPVDQLKKSGHLVAFTVDGIHPHDVAAQLNKAGICVRAGHHCAQPLAKKMGIASSVRASFYAYNTRKEVDHLVNELKKTTYCALALNDLAG